jgi:hypothetical protein
MVEANPKSYKERQREARAEARAKNPMQGPRAYSLLDDDVLKKKAPAGGDRGLTDRRRGVGGCGECLRSEFTLTAASLSVPPHSVAKDHHAP